MARYHEWLEAAESQVGRGDLLEVGAGRGGFVRAAMARGWTVHATEVSESALDDLRAAGATVFFGDVGEARYPDDRFELVVSLEVLEHLSDPMTHLRELHRVTRPGGLLLLTTPNFCGASRRLLGTRWRVIAAEHVVYFSPLTLSGALRLAGYRHVRVVTRSLDISTWRRTIGGGAPGFDPQRSAELRDAVQQSAALRLLKDGVNAILRVTGLGDSLLAWARK
jgi:2-polyprenyl-3-methyl-5-hydroxy-6-metoxy-1,4-benzoquinol methylase